MNLHLQVLDKNQHNPKNFDCGKQGMNAFLQKFALKNQQLGLSKSWVLVDNNNPQTIIGYFTLSIQTIEPQLIEEEKLPKYQLPVTLIARIAVDKTFQGKGFGRKLLFLALKKSLQLNNHGLPTYAIVLDILDNDAKEFYQQFNFFKELDNSGRKLFVPMKIIRELFV